MQSGIAGKAVCLSRGKGEFNMKKKLLYALSGAALSVVILSGCGKASEKTTSDQVNPPKQSTADDAQQNTDDEKQQPDQKPDNTNAEQDTATDQSGTNGNITIALPQQDDPRWASDAQVMRTELEAKGYTVNVQFAETGSQQAEQIEASVKSQTDCIVVAAIDSGQLTDAAQSAKDAKIPVIAYDRLLMDTDAVYYYTAFDKKGTGQAIGRRIAEKAKLEELADDAYQTIEFFMGSPDDPEAELVYDGLMEVLQPYLDCGKLVCKTGRTSFADTSINECSQEAAQERCKNYLAGYYADEELDICAAAYDTLAYGCKDALQSAGYIADNWPVISGQGCEIKACKNILDGTQAFSIYKDTSILAKQCAAMTDAVVSGTEQPEINDTEQSDNHKLLVPAYLCAPVTIDADNLQKVLVDSGYYTKEQLDTAE